MKKTLYDSQVELMLKLLPVVADEDCFALKGGTAINFFIRDLPRLSIDIDLSYMPLEDRVTTGKNITKALLNISRTIESKYPNTQIKQTMFEKEQFVKRLIVINNGIRVKIEPNYVLRGSVYKTDIAVTSKKVKQLYNVQANMQILSVADLYGGKLCAMLDRQHPRDIFDIKILMEHEGLTDEIRKAFVIYLASSNRPVVELLAPIKQDITNVFNENFYGMAFNDVTIDELIAVREEVIKQINDELTNNERKFLLSIKTGTPDFNLIDIDGVDLLPGIKWKLRNVNNIPTAKQKEAVEKLRRVLKI
jgi:predicted nucleotidyltransferase component of viral defense system